MEIIFYVKVVLPSNKIYDAKRESPRNRRGDWD